MDDTDDMRAYVDTQIRDVRRAVEVAADQPTRDAVDLRQYIEALLAEREKAASALRGGVEHALQADYDRLRDAIEAVRGTVADMERTMSDRVVSGDLHLRQHIDQQYDQINAALTSSLRETQIIHAASEKAIEKSEASVEKRFGATNGFREQLGEQAATFMPRDLADASMATLNTRINDLDKRIALNTEQLLLNRGRDGAVEKSTEDFTAIKLAIAGFAVTFVVTAVIIVAGFLTP